MISPLYKNSKWWWIARREEKKTLAEKKLVGQAEMVIRTYWTATERGNPKSGRSKQNQTVYTWQSMKHTPQYLHHCRRVACSYTPSALAKNSQIKKKQSGDTYTQIKIKSLLQCLEQWKWLCCAGGAFDYAENLATLRGRGRGWRFFPTKAAKNQCQSQYHSSTSNSFKIVNESKM